MKNPFAFCSLLLIDTAVGAAMPVGYVTNCGFPVFYGLMWQLLHLDPALPRPARKPFPVI